MFQMGESIHLFEKLRVAIQVINLILYESGNYKNEYAKQTTN